MRHEKRLSESDTAADTQHAELAAATAEVLAMRSELAAVKVAPAAGSYRSARVSAPVRAAARLLLLLLHADRTVACNIIPPYFCRSKALPW